MTVEAQAGQPARKLGGGWEVIGAPECPLLYRRTILSTPWLKILWHRFVASASDHDPHDHPRAFVTVVLRGGYDDVTLCPCGGPGATIYTDGEGLERVRLCQPRCNAAGEVVETLRAPTIRYRPAAHAHITRVHDTGATTLVVMGPLVRAWGFIRDGRWWLWADYEREYGLAFRCEDDTR